MAELGQLAELYVSGRRKRGEIGAATARNNRLVLATVTATYGDRPVVNFRTLHVERWLETRSHLAVSTRRENFSVVRGFCAWLTKNEYVKRDPMADMKPPPKPRTIPRAMPESDVGKLFDVAPDPRARAIVALGVGCGLRCVEISRLRVEDWDRVGKTLRIVGKGGHQRELPVPQFVQEALAAYIVAFPATTGPMIRSYVQRSKGLLPATISDLVGSWMALAGVKTGPRDGVSAHALRHTAASDVLDASGDLRVVQEMLGHEHLSTTAIYLRRAGIGRLRDAMEGRSYTGRIQA